MEPGGSMLHSHWLSNPYPEPNQPNSPHWYLSLHLCLDLPKGLFPVGLPVKILKHSYFPPFWLHALPISSHNNFNHSYNFFYDIWCLPIPIHSRLPLYILQVSFFHYFQNLLMSRSSLLLSTGTHVDTL